MNQIARFSSEALKTCPTTSWKPRVVYDYDGGRLSLENMISQLQGQANQSRAQIYTMLIEWALTGKWPRFRNAPVFFVREILTWSASHHNYPPERDFPELPPPWKSQYAAKFLANTALFWLNTTSKEWAREEAEQEYEFQESRFNSTNPFD